MEGEFESSDRRGDATGRRLASTSHGLSVSFERRRIGTDVD